MHCISSSLCFWFWSILRETADSLYHKMSESNSSIDKHHYHHHAPHPHYIPHVEIDNTSAVNVYHALHLTGFNSGMKKNK